MTRTNSMVIVGLSLLIGLVAAWETASADCGFVPVVVFCKPGEAITVTGGGGQQTNPVPIEPDPIKPDPTASDDETDKDKDGISDKLAATFTQEVLDGKGVKVEEPIQEAVIAWNGKEEIMVLSTKVRASRKTLLIEILPLPSRPKIAQGDEKLFGKALELLGAPRSVLEKQTIGGHHISVIHVSKKERAGFVDWLRDYLKKEVQFVGKEGRKVPASPYFSDTAKQVIDEYLRDGFQYFVVDVIDAQEEAARRTAIRYRFPSGMVYYPLRISRMSGEGQTHVQLVVLSTEKLSTFGGKLPQEQIKVSLDRKDPLTPEQLRGLNPEIGEHFGEKSAHARLWELKGEIDKFPGDVLAIAKKTRK